MLRHLVCLAAAVLPQCVLADSYQDYYRQRGTTLPRTVSSDPMSPPSGVDGADHGLPLNMSREARREFEGRYRAERDARDAAAQARDHPEIHFNIRPPEMPKPVAAD
ncbi:hypothetical protein LFL96_04540 [Paraburkholderia sp. D15]|uniref:hypothetical protein n=1 Tax=Paraburkholderia sp. D15 TaxID=2880218 RepID=UPI002478671D|nr:hypothetical protein [Paraburkholderia sp. D15]WGS50780.1 hypothetical protein LFL96_04540 [Paraburkholderia sp. D15]